MSATACKDDIPGCRFLGKPNGWKRILVVKYIQILPDRLQAMTVMVGVTPVQRPVEKLKIASRTARLLWSGLAMENGLEVLVGCGAGCRIIIQGH